MPASCRVYVHDLCLGMQHTNYRGLSEPLLLMHAGHFQWASIAAAIGTPISQLRTSANGEVYPGFYFVEERFPIDAPLESFKVDDEIRFIVRLRAVRNMAIEGTIVFGRLSQLPDCESGSVCFDTAREGTRFPWIRCCNIFMEPRGSNRSIRVSPPANADFSALPQLCDDENPYHLTRGALNGETLGVMDGTWRPIATFSHRYPIDSDRDTNGAGLVYFANYVSFMTTAERLAMERLERPFSMLALESRSLRHRRIAYYGNADIGDTVSVHVDVYQIGCRLDSLGLKYAIVRDVDQQTICLCEAIKALG